MSDSGWELDEEFERELARDPILEARRQRAGLPRHVKCSCDECAGWRSKNWQRIEFLDWNPKEKPISPNIAVAKPQHNTILTDLSQAVEKIDKAAAAFGVKDSVSGALLRALEAGSYSYKPAAVDPGPDLSDPDYTLALSMQGKTDWASVKRRMDSIKRARKTDSRPRPIATAGAGKKVRY